MRLTAKKVALLLRRGEPGNHYDGQGLRLEIKSPTSAAWVSRFQIDGRERWMGLGSARTFGLAEARERNRKLVRQKVADRVDPLAARRAERAKQAAAAAKVMTFAEAAQTYHRQHASKWKNYKHATQFINTLKQYVFPILGPLSVAEIDTGLVLKVLEQKVDDGTLWTERTETASRVRGRIEAVLGWCTVRGYRSGDNPAKWKSHLGEALPSRGAIAKVEHHAALPWRELPAFMAALRERDGIAARALEFTILTVARTGEVIGAKWDEINDDIWTIPAGRMKAAREHRVAFSRPAIELLSSLYREDGNDHVFIGPQAGSGLSNMAMSAVLRRMGRGDITVHGFRSSFMDWAHECTAFPKVAIDMALAHTVGDKVEAAYRRGDLFAKRKALAEAWAKYCTSPSVKKTGDVVPIRERVS